MMLGMVSGHEGFTGDDLYDLSGLVTTTWMSTADRDWSVPAGTVEWSCTKTAVRAVIVRHPSVGGDLLAGSGRARQSNPASG